MISGTLAFMVGTDDSSAQKIRPDEVEPLRESLNFLKENNQHIKEFLTNWERFSGKR